jgi:hypothetical protein
MAGELTALGGAAGFFLGGPTGAAIGASLGSGIEGQQAAGEAADVQAQAAQAGIAEQRRQFDITQQQMQPWQEAGASALAQQQALMGMGTPEEQQQAFAAFEQSPGQSFLRAQQERALLRNASAIGGLGGGNVRTALQQQAAGFAQQDYQNQLNRLAGLSGTGQQAATNIGQFGAGAASNIASLQATGGQARASGILGQQQQAAQTTQNLIGLGGQFGAFGTPPPTTASMGGFGTTPTNPFPTMTPYGA